MKNVVLVARDMIPSVVLCADAQLRWLAEKNYVNYRRIPPLLCGIGTILWADVLVFVRSDDSASLAAAETARRAGKYGIYVLDDDLLNVPPGMESSEYYARPETKARIRRIMGECRCFLTPSPVLLEKYGGGFETAAQIEEPCLSVQPLRRPPSGTVRIGFAGSVDRAGDLDAFVAGALRRVRERYGNYVNFDFFGALPAAAGELGARHIPYENDYGRYRRTMAALGWDIALAPLPDTAFHRCKHYNKYIEYAACGVPGIYSDAAVYRRAVRDGENGLLAENTEEAWFEALCKLIEDRPLRRLLRENALAEAGERYSLESAAEVWRGLIDSVPAGRSVRAALGLRLRWAVRRFLIAAGKLAARGRRFLTAALRRLSGEGRA